APFRGMLAAHLSETSPPVTLLFGVRYESHLLYRREFEALAAKFPQFRFEPTLTRPDAGWSGGTGRVQSHFPSLVLDSNGNRRHLVIYWWGMKQMVDDSRTILKGMGFDRKQILYKKYD